MFPLNLYERKKNIVPIKDKIYFNSGTVIDTSSRRSPVHFCICGKTGTGKTVADFVVGEQVPAAILLDPKGNIDDIDSVLSFMKIKENWNLFRIRGSYARKDKHDLKINIREVGPSAVNVVCLKKENSSDVKLKRVLHPFLSLSPDNPHKTFDNFEKLLKSNKLDFVFDELKVILDENDEGMSLEELCTGKKYVDVHSFDSDNRAIGLLVESIFNYRRNHSSREKLLIGVDEMHVFCKASTSVGTAFGYVFSQGRSFNIMGLVSGTNFGDLEKHIKANIAVYVLFKSDFEKDKFFHDLGVDIDFDSLKELERRHGKFGNGFLKAEDLGFYPPVPIHIDPFYYQEIRKNTEDVVVDSFEDYL